MADVTITKAAVGVFNCQQTKPKSGRSYMADQPLEECWVDGGLQARLLVPAACVLAFYCIGFPVLILVIYCWNSKKIAADQMLRARGTGNSRATNPNYLFRKSVGKLYLMFKPQYYYWIQPVLARKFLLIGISAFLRDNPSMQMAISLVIIFLSFAAHVHALPYLGPMEKMQIVAEHTTKEIMKTSARLNMIEMASQMDGSVDQAERDAINVVRHHLDDLNKELISEKKILGKHHHEIFNFNTLEETMLASGILVTLTGVMFTSPFLLDEENRTVQRAVVFTVISVIGFTLVYWLIFFIREICIAKHQKSQRSKLKWASLKGGKSKRSLLKHINKGKEKLSSHGDSNENKFASGGWMNDSKSNTKVTPINKPRKLLQGPIGKDDKVNDLRSWGTEQKQPKKKKIAKKKSIHFNDHPEEEEEEELSTFLLPSDSDPDSDPEDEPAALESTTNTTNTTGSEKVNNPLESTTNTTGNKKMNKPLFKRTETETIM